MFTDHARKWTRFGFVLAAAAAGSTALAQPPARAPALKPELSSLGFLVGDWSGGRGKVADTGGTSTGSSRIEVAVNGAVLLRRDHTNLFDASGKPTGGFEQIMMIYPERGALHADYSDGSHVIHYTSAVVAPGKSVIFASDISPSAPAFRLAYTLSTPTTLEVAFSMAPPGGGEFHPIATGTLTKAP